MRKIVGGLSIGVAVFLCGLAAVLFLVNLAGTARAIATHGVFYAVGMLTGGVLFTAPFALLGRKAFHFGRSRFAQPLEVS